jgi:hypothetical protein
MHPHASFTLHFLSNKIIIFLKTIILLWLYVEILFQIDLKFSKSIFKPLFKPSLVFLKRMLQEKKEFPEKKGGIRRKAALLAI